MNIAELISPPLLCFFHRSITDLPLPHPHPTPSLPHPLDESTLGPGCPLDQAWLILQIFSSTGGSSSQEGGIRKGGKCCKTTKMERWKVGATTQERKAGRQAFCFSVMETVVQLAHHHHHQSKHQLSCWRHFGKRVASRAGARFPRLLCATAAPANPAVSSVPPGPPGRKEGSVHASSNSWNETPLKGTAGYLPSNRPYNGHCRAQIAAMVLAATS